MAAPVATPRGTPAGLPMKDGYRCLITFASKPTLELWEKTVTPPGFDGGDKIDVTTMHNNDLRTFEPRQLVTMTPAGATCAYDPGVLASAGGILDLINRKDTITVRFTDGTTWAFFGFLKSFTPQECAEGAQPTAQVSIEPMNKDTSDVERLPVVVSVSGT